MIAQGTDGLSQGDLTEGVMEGLAMSEFVPIHMGAVLVVKDPLVDWLQSWAGAEAQCLEETEWLTVGQDLGKGGKPNADGVWIPEYSTGLTFGAHTCWIQGRCENCDVLGTSNKSPLMCLFVHI